MNAEHMAEMEPEIVAMSAVYAALKGLEPDVQQRVLGWIAAKLKIDNSLKTQQRDDEQNFSGSVIAHEPEIEDAVGILDGVSAVAKRWITRSALRPDRLSTLFSLGGEEVDLIANAVPGAKKKDRMHNVFLLKGVAAYLGTGAARFTYEQIREACLHYDAFDVSNFATYLKSFSGEVTGNKESGYTLTPRGLANATDIVKQLIQS